MFDFPLKTIQHLSLFVVCLSFVRACPYLFLFVHPSLHTILVFALLCMLACDSIANVCKLFVRMIFRSYLLFSNQ